MFLVVVAFEEALEFVFEPDETVNDRCSIGEHESNDVTGELERSLT